MKKFKWLLHVCFLLMSVALLATFMPQTARADFAERPVGFVVIDQDGGVDGAVYKEWRQMVKLGSLSRLSNNRWRRASDAGEPGSA